MSLFCDYILYICWNIDWKLNLIIVGIAMRYSRMSPDSVHAVQHESAPSHEVTLQFKCIPISSFCASSRGVQCSKLIALRAQSIQVPLSASIMAACSICPEQTNGPVMIRGLQLTLIKVLCSLREGSHLADMSVLFLHELVYAAIFAHLDLQKTYITVR